MAETAPAPSSDVVTLKVGGRVFEGWTSVTVAKGIKNPAGAFSLEYAQRTDQPGGEAAAAITAQIRTGQACEVLIGGELVITGWVDATAPAFDAGSRSIRVEGRDKAGDLIDCSAMNAPGVWKGRTLIQIAADLTAPFGIAVSAEAEVGPAFKAFAIQQGETVWEALERLARFRGLLATSTPAGAVAFIRPGGRRASFGLAQGQHLMAAAAGHDARDRFSRYVLKGQSAGDDEINGEAAASPRAEAVDAAITRPRPTLIVAEEQATLASLKARAGWEASVRAAIGSRVDLTVQGWRDPAGAIWAADLVVPVTAPWIEVEGDLLIADVVFALDESGGSRTTLTCAPPDAYRPEPPAAEPAS
jgi:prophage tail gpP-like protein